MGVRSGFRGPSLPFAWDPRPAFTWEWSHWGLRTTIPDSMTLPMVDSGFDGSRHVFISVHFPELYLYIKQAVEMHTATIIRF